MSRIIQYAIVFMFLAAPVHATTVLYQNFDDLVDKSEVVLKGRVKNKESFKNNEGGIFTYVTLDNIEVISGDYNEKEYIMLLEGGDVGAEIQEIPGTPEFEDGERVILFVSGNGKSPVPLVGWSQGLFRVKKAQDTNQDIVTDSNGNRIFAIEGNAVKKENRFNDSANILGKKEDTYILRKMNNLPDADNKPHMSAGTPDSGEASQALAVYQIMGMGDPASEKSQGNVNQKSGDLNAMSVQDFKNKAKNSVKERNKKYSKINKLDRDYKGYPSNGADIARGDGMSTPVNPNSPKGQGKGQGTHLPVLQSTNIPEGK